MRGGGEEGLVASELRRRRITDEVQRRRPRLGDVGLAAPDVRGNAQSPRDLRSGRSVRGVQLRGAAVGVGELVPTYVAVKTLVPTKQ